MKTSQIIQKYSVAFFILSLLPAQIFCASQDRQKSKRRKIERPVTFDSLSSLLHKQDLQSEQFIPLLKKYLAREGSASINHAEDENGTLLYQACESLIESIDDHTEIVEALLDAKADPDFVNKDFLDMTPLMVSRKPEIIKLLLRHGALIDRVDTEGKTALANAFFRDKKENALALMKAGANLNIRTEEGSTVLGIALGCEYEDRDASEGCFHSSLISLLSRNVDLDVPLNEQDETPLQYAFERRCPACLYLIYNELKKRPAKIATAVTQFNTMSHMVRDESDLDELGLGQYIAAYAQNEKDSRYAPRHNLNKN